MLLLCFVTMVACQKTRLVLKTSFGLCLAVVSKNNGEMGDLSDLQRGQIMDLHFVLCKSNSVHTVRMRFLGPTCLDVKLKKLNKSITRRFEAVLKASICPTLLIKDFA